MKACFIEGCGRPLCARAMCKVHYDRWHRHGDPHVCLKPMVTRGTPMAWLKRHVWYQGDECLAWPFATYPDGRPQMKAGRPTRIMCELAHGKSPTPTHQAAHSCGKGHEGCVNPRHLRWATPSENNADMDVHGTRPRGSKLPFTKLSDDEVRQIRALVGTIPKKDIAARFGVNPSCVSKIIHGQSRASVLP